MYVASIPAFSDSISIPMFFFFLLFFFILFCKSLAFLLSLFSIFCDIESSVITLLFFQNLTQARDCFT